MPRQNRVTPRGDIVATTARGSCMGNRGCLHDEHGTIRRAYQSRRWIICLLEFRGRRLSIMAPGRYTQLFFLDEATALAAGHRPCAECQRAKFDVFRAHWVAANADLVDSPVPRIDIIDTVLHRERISDDHYQRDKIKRSYSARLDELPDRVFVVLPSSDTPYLVRGDALLPWSFAGYGRPIARPVVVAQVLTPRSTVRALAHGYRADLHSSALQMA
jgi:hypothetical protein